MKVDLIFTEAKDFAYRSAVCESVADQLAVVGIQVNIIEKSDEDYKTALSQRNFDLALCAYSMKSNQEIDFLFSAENNYGGYNSGTLKEQLQAAHSALTEGRTADRLYGTAKITFGGHAKYWIVLWRTFLDYEQRYIDRKAAGIQKYFCKY